MKRPFLQPFAPAPTPPRTYAPDDAAFAAWFKLGPFWVTLLGVAGGANSGRSPLGTRASGEKLRPRECYLGLNHAGIDRALARRKQVPGPVYKRLETGTSAVRSRMHEQSE